MSMHLYEEEMASSPVVVLIGGLLLVLIMLLCFVIYFYQFRPSHLLLWLNGSIAKSEFQNPSNSTRRYYNSSFQQQAQQKKKQKKRTHSSITLPSEGEPLLHITNGGDDQAAPIFTTAMLELEACKWDTDQIEQLLDGYNICTMLTSELKADHFAAYCSNVTLSKLSVFTLSSIVLGLFPYANKNYVVARTIRDCFCSATDPIVCTELKLLVEKEASIFQLIFGEIQTHNALYQDILAHFSNLSCIMRQEGVKPPIKVLSDIDDTLYSVLFDKRFPPMTLYPGVLQCFQELCGNSLCNNIVFLTARPEFLRYRTAQHIKKCGINGFILLMGSIGNLFGTKRMASRKLENFKEYKKLFPEFKFIFVGDNGQGDIDLGKFLLKDPSVISVLIHDVIRNSDSTVPPYRSLECRQIGINMFTNYIGASLCCYRNDLLSLNSIIRIVEVVAHQFSNISFESDEQKQLCCNEIMKDLSQMLQFLPTEDALRLLCCIGDSFIVDVRGPIKDDVVAIEVVDI